MPCGWSDAVLKGVGPYGIPVNIERRGGHVSGCLPVELARERFGHLGPFRVRNAVLGGLLARRGCVPFSIERLIDRHSEMPYRIEGFGLLHGRSVRRPGGDVQGGRDWACRDDTA